MTRNNMLETKFKGDEEAYRKFMAEIGRKGGSAKVPKGTAKWSPAKLKRVGAKGGRIRRGKKPV